MTDLISILVLFYSVQGIEMESEMPLASAQCEAAQRGIAAAIQTNGDKRKNGPSVELWNGQRVPVQAASCLHACVTEDGLPDLELLARISFVDQPAAANAPLLN